MELGGKNFALVLDDARIEQAADHIIAGAFLNVSRRQEDTVDHVLTDHRMAKSACPQTSFMRLIPSPQL